MNTKPVLLVAMALTLSGSALVWANARESSSSATAAPPANAEPSAQPVASANERAERLAEAAAADEQPAVSAAANPPMTAEAGTTPAPTRHDEAVMLDPVVVESPALPTPGEVATTKGAAAAAREKYFTNEADRALNTYTIPVIGVTPEERSLETERQEKREAAISDTKRMVVLARQDGSDQAGALQTELHQITVRNDFIEDTTPSTLRRD